MKPIKNIIFDFGGVFLNIDFTRSYIEFQKLGIPSFHKLFDGYLQTNLFRDLEIGTISSKQFADSIRYLAGMNLTDAQIFYAWNALLLDLPAKRLSVLKTAASHYRIFLLSNTNQIHYEVYNSDFRNKYGYDFNDLFEKAFWSHQIGVRKPEASAFDYVINQTGIIKEETLFIDDGIMHIQSAKAMGFRVHHLISKEINELFDNLGRLIEY
ncbi:MAG: HAD family phosphatase [Bacteroidales bacterium]|jgi:putative hydrolase of the HAD superfamily|nr:HAD family phosphatase [Bacteroidales bacterium]